MPDTSEHGALLRRSDNGSALNFQQQGSVDWTRIGSASVNISIDFLARMSRAGVEALTVATAQTVLAKLKLSDAGEERVQTAVGKLSAYSSFNTGLWFGFGVKHVIRELAETREGLNVIAVCSALVEKYPIIDVARTLRELLTLYNVPQDLTPSLKQWMAIVEACAGALALTEFGSILHNISCYYIGSSAHVHRGGHSSPVAIARALQGLIAVSNGSLEQIQFLGGADCAFFAAFSLWLLDLPVEVRDAQGETVFKSSSISTRETKVLINLGGDTSSPLKITHRIFLLPPEQSLIQRDSLSYLQFLASYGRVPWQHLLCDVFGGSMKGLLCEPLVSHLLAALGSAARLFTAVVFEENGVHKLMKNSYDRVRFLWKSINSASHGRGFVDTIHRFLPEIADLEKFKDIMNGCLRLDLRQAGLSYEKALRTIENSRLCLCSWHKTQFLSDHSDRTHFEPYCQVRLIMTIIELVKQLSSVSVPEGLYITRRGIEDIYACSPQYEQDADFVTQIFGVNNEYVKHGIFGFNELKGLMDQVQGLFSHRPCPSRGYCALAGSGLCFYLDLLINPSTDQDHCGLIHVAPGRVEWNNNHYNSLSDAIRAPSDEFIDGLKMAYMDYNLWQPEPVTQSAQLRCDLIVDERSDANSLVELAAGYRFRSSHDTRSVIYGPEALARKFIAFLVTKDCKGRMCGQLASLPPNRVSRNRVRISRPLTDVASQLQAIGFANDESPLVSNSAMYFFQGKACLYCVLYSALVGERRRELSDALPADDANYDIHVMVTQV